MVDGEYTQYQTETVFDTLNEQQFAQLEAEEKITTVDKSVFIMLSVSFFPLLVKK